MRRASNSLSLSLSLSSRVAAALLRSKRLFTRPHRVIVHVPRAHVTAHIYAHQVMPERV